MNGDWVDEIFTGERTPQPDETKMPPRPAGSNDANTDPDSPLKRYGRASKESGLLLEPMADGYWTPWHIANEMLREAQRNAGVQVLPTIPESAVLHRMKYHHWEADPAVPDDVADWELFDPNITCDDCIEVLIVRARAAARGVPTPVNDQPKES